eukprot:COSAG06_NODE_33104_length_495_cov_0.909091_1_plen_101_part_01
MAHAGLQRATGQDRERGAGTLRPQKDTTHGLSDTVYSLRSRKSRPTAFRQRLPWREQVHACLDDGQSFFAAMVRQAAVVMMRLYTLSVLWGVMEVEADIET